MSDSSLSYYADIVTDLEKTRLATENRLRSLTRDAADADGEIRGLGLPDDHPDVVTLVKIVAGLGDLEHQVILDLQRALRRHPLGKWVKGQKGIGEKQGARLLAAIGDPYWSTLTDSPRTVSQLHAYCGYHVLPAGHVSLDAQVTTAGGAKTSDSRGHIRNDAQDRLVAGVAARRQKGQRANWSTEAKTRAHLVAESCMKQPTGTYYRGVYEDGRKKYAEAVHKTPCVQCGPKGKPAQVGSLISPGHQHARALRLVAKEILKDLWRESKRLHDTSPPANHHAVPTPFLPAGRAT